MSSLVITKIRGGNKKLPKQTRISLDTTQKRVEKMKFRMQKCSPSKSPKKKKPVALVCGDSAETDATIRTECRTQMTHGMIEAYGLHRYMYTIPMEPGNFYFP